MDEKFLKLYEEELGHIREVGAEFGRQYPKVAGRLAAGRDGCEDPFVERMIEGFAFLAARVRRKLDAEFPRFCESLAETVYPQLLSPTPSMTIVGFEPDPKLTESFLIPRGTVLTSHLLAETDTRCQFVTAHDVPLRPVRLSTTEPPRYFSRDIEKLRLPSNAKARAAIRLRLESLQSDKLFDAIEDFDELTFHLAGALGAAGAIFEEILTRCTHVHIRPVSDDGRIHPGFLIPIDGDGLALEPLGFDASQAMLPPDKRTFEGYRLLREFSAMPERLLFFRIRGGNLAKAFAQCASPAIELSFVLNRSREELYRMTDSGRFALFATPAINLFERRADQILLADSHGESHVVVDRTSPASYEVMEILSVKGLGDSLGPSGVTIEPFYRTPDGSHDRGGYFTIRREMRRATLRERRFGFSSGYLGSEVYLFVASDNGAGVLEELNALSVRVRCSNRHLPMLMPVGQHETDFFADAGIPVVAAKCLKRPTRPLIAPLDDDSSWRVISHLSLNYLSLVNEPEGLDALKEVLGIYFSSLPASDVHGLDCLVGVSSKPVVRRHSGVGPVAFVRGLEVELAIDEERLAGSSAYLLGAVLANFFSRYVSINSFVETRLVSNRRGLIAKWSGIQGNRQIL